MQVCVVIFSCVTLRGLSQLCALPSIFLLTSAPASTQAVKLTGLTLAVSVTGSVCSSRWIDDKKEAARIAQHYSVYINTHIFQCGLVTQLSEHTTGASQRCRLRVCVCVHQAFKTSFTSVTRTHDSYHSSESVLAGRAVFMIHFLGM